MKEMFGPQKISRIEMFARGNGPFMQNDKWSQIFWYKEEQGLKHLEPLMKHTIIFSLFPSS